MDFKEWWNENQYRFAMKEESARELFKEITELERKRCEQVVIDNYMAAPYPRGMDILSDIRKGE